MIRGTKPTLTIVKQATAAIDRGNFNENPPEPKGEVKKPGFVKGSAITLWKKYAPQLQEQKVLTGWDCEMFGVWCCLMAEFQKDPNRFVTAKLTQMRLLAEMFGMAGAVSRERIKTSGKGNNTDPAEQYFA